MKNISILLSFFVLSACGKTSSDGTKTQSQSEQSMVLPSNVNELMKKVNSSDLPPEEQEALRALVRLYGFEVLRNIQDTVVRDGLITSNVIVRQIKTGAKAGIIAVGLSYSALAGLAAISGASAGVAGSMIAGAPALAWLEGIGIVVSGTSAGLTGKIDALKFNASIETLNQILRAENELMIETRLLLGRLSLQSLNNIQIKYNDFVSDIVNSEPLSATIELKKAILKIKRGS